MMPSVVVIARASSTPFAGELAQQLAEHLDSAALFTTDEPISALRTEAMHLRGRTPTVVVVADGGLVGREFERWIELAGLVKHWIHPRAIFVVFASELGGRRAQRLSVELEAELTLSYEDRPGKLSEAAEAVVGRLLPFLTSEADTDQRQVAPTRRFSAAARRAFHRSSQYSLASIGAAAIIFTIFVAAALSRSFVADASDTWTSALSAASALAAAFLVFLLAIRFRDTREELVAEIESMRRGLEGEMARQRLTLSESTQRLASFATPIAGAASGEVGETPPSTGSATLAKEISHAVQTPLSQIAAAAELLAGDPADPHEIAALAERIRTSVAVSQAFLSAFRDLEGMSPGARSSTSLREMMLAGASVYNPNGSGVEVAVQVPQEVAGYSVEYLCAILFPIVENAVEAGEPDTTVTIGYRRESLANIFTVAGTSRQLPGGDEIYEPGRSTKTGHEGMGLCMVKTLIASVEGGSISHRVQDHKVTFSVALPQQYA